MQRAISILALFWLVFFAAFDAEAQNQKISGLTALTGANTATDDEFAIVDTDATETKRITRAELAVALTSAGTQTLWLPADMWTPAVTNGADAFASAETTATRPDVNHLGFATAADDFAQASISFSTAWDLGTVTFQVQWAHAATSTPFGVAWFLQCVSVGNDGTIDVVYGTAVGVTDTGGTTEDLYTTAESSAVTCGGTPADGDVTFFQIYRDVSDAGDDLAINADLIGVKIFFTTDTSI